MTHTDVTVVEAAERPALALLQNLHHRAVEHLRLLLAQPRRLALPAGQIGDDDPPVWCGLVQHADAAGFPTGFGHTMAQVFRYRVQRGFVQHSAFQVLAAVTLDDFQPADVESGIGKRLLGFFQGLIKLFVHNIQKCIRRFRSFNPL